jgi:hypothetical protein
MARTTSDEMARSRASRLTSAHFRLAVQRENGEESGRRAGVDPKPSFTNTPRRTLKLHRATFSSQKDRRVVTRTMKVASWPRYAGRGRVTGAGLNEENSSENGHSLMRRATIDGNAKVRPICDTTTCS